MPQNIDASLKSIMDPLLTIARGTFAKDWDEDTLINTTLLTWAGMGLVHYVCGQKGLTWFPTKLLTEASKQPRMPFDLTPLMAPPTELSNKPHMTGSLRLIIEAIVEIKRRQEPELTNENNFDAMVFALAGKGMASLNDVLSDKPIWWASPDLVDQFESMKAELCGKVSNRKTEIILDDLLQGVTPLWGQLAETQLGKKLPKRKTAILTLLVQELAGDAIAYMDEKGRLAWKASDEFRREFEED